MTMASRGAGFLPFVFFPPAFVFAGGFSPPEAGSSVGALSVGAAAEPGPLVVAVRADLRGPLASASVGASALRLPARVSGGGASDASDWTRPFALDRVRAEGTGGAGSSAAGRSAAGSSATDSSGLS